MEELLRATQAESVRALVRSVNVDRAYDLRGNDTGPMIAHLNDKLLEPYGVSVDLVSIACKSMSKGQTSWQTNLGTASDYSSEEHCSCDSK